MKSGDNEEYIAEYPTLKGVVGIGPSALAAVAHLEESAEVNLKALFEAGLPVPESDSLVRNEYSGKLSVRLSRGLHKLVADLSEKEGVSINQCIVEAVSMYVGKKSLENNLNSSTSVNTIPSRDSYRSGPTKTSLFGK